MAVIHTFFATFGPSRRNRNFFFPALCLLFVLSLPFAAIASKSETPSSSGSVQGRASWYGTTAHGKVTANGEIFNRYSFTAAHRSIPFGTVVRVHNLKNGRYVLVRINDRGPQPKNRLLDVSRRAADSLKMFTPGVVPIAVQVISDRHGVPLEKENAFYVVIRNERNALKAQALSIRYSNKLGQPVKILFSLQEKRPTNALCLGPFTSFEQAQEEFSRCEENNMRLHSIVEASAKGREIPRRVVPGNTVWDAAHRLTAHNVLKTVKAAVSGIFL